MRTHLVGPRRRSSRRGAAIGALIACAVLLPAPGTVAAPRDVPSASEVAEQRAEADRLAAQAAAQQGDLATAQAQLDALATQASDALERYEVAQQAVDQARAQHWTESERLANAQETATRSRGELGRWAAQAYRSGGASSELGGVAALLDARSTDDLSLRLMTLSRVGRSRDVVVDQAVAAEREQADAEARAEESARVAMELATAAEAAKAESEQLVAAQREQVAALQATLDAARGVAADAQAEADRLSQARAIADAERIATTSSPTWSPNEVTGTVGSCAGGDVRGFGNGRLPSAALCPLWGAPGHLLRADAAHAYEQLATAYASAFGRPLCVTDSYRTYDAQVRVRAAKPTLAAVPGTSNHGWGKAVDLCGGIQSFGSSEHRWMQANAPQHGWFHPTWARQGGSKPEAWHWEFAG